MRKLPIVVAGVIGVLIPPVWQFGALFGMHSRAAFWNGYYLFGVIVWPFKLLYIPGIAGEVVTFGLNGLLYALVAFIVLRLRRHARP